MADDRMSLGDILGGAERPVEQPAPEAQPASEAAAQPTPAAEPVERQRNPDGTFAQKEAQKEAPKAEPKEAPKEQPKEAPKEELTAKEKAFLRAAQEERDKRQRLEAELAQYRQQPAQQQPQPEPKPFIEDPDGALKAFEERVMRGVQTGNMTNRVLTSEAIARSKYQDYDDKVAVFSRLCQGQNGNAYLQACMTAPDPAEFVYKTVKEIQDRYEWQQAGGMEGMRAKIEKEARVKWETEQAEKEKLRQAQTEALPKSLSDVQGRGNAGAPVWTGPAPLADILKH